MSDVINDDDLSALAAEYVLGTLEPDERTRANVLLDVDQGFRGLVRVWERRFGELHLMVEPVEPDPKIWERIKGKLGMPQTEVAVAPPPLPPPLPPALPLVEAPPELQPAKFAEGIADKTVAEAAPESTADLMFAELVEEVDKVAANTRSAEEAIAEPSAVETPPPLTADLLKAAQEWADEAKPLPQETMPSVVVGPRALETRSVVMPLRKRPPPAGPWRAVALLMTFIAVGLSGLIAAWRFVPDRLPEPLRPVTVLKIGEPSDPAERKPAPHGTQFEE
jgi:hypothetical protein